MSLLALMKPTRLRTDAKQDSPMTLKKKLINFLFLYLLAALALGTNSGSGSRRTQKELQRFEYRQLQMGTEFRIVLYATDQLQAREASRAAFDRIERLEDIMSDYRAESELLAACRVAEARPKVLSSELFHVLQLSQRLSIQTRGAFDITIKPLIELWKLAHQEGRLPRQDEIDSTRNIVGFRKLLLNPRTRSLRFRVEGVQLDLGAVGKGFAADEALKRLAEMGFARAMIDAGGDLRLGQRPPGQPGWRIRLNDGVNWPLQFTLSETAVASSSGTLRWVEIDGMKYSHILDPRTGWPVTHGGVATVIAPSAATADALATALSVLEVQAGLAIIDRMDRVEALVSRLSNDCHSRQSNHCYKIYRSSGFPP